MGVPDDIMGIPSPLVLMPVIADKTTDIDFFLGAIDTVRNGPSVLAQTFMTLDHATKGRAFFALGGSEMKQLSPYGYSRIGSAKKLEESLIINRRLFEADGAPVFFDGVFYSMNGGSMSFCCYRHGQPTSILVTSCCYTEIVGRFSVGLIINTL